MTSNESKNKTGLQKFKFSSAESLQNIKSLPVEKIKGSYGCTALQVEGNYLYAAGNNYFSVYNISKDTEKPRLIFSIQGLTVSRQMAVYKDNVYITGRNKGLWIVDIKNPEKPKLICRYDTIELATGIAAIENVVFVAQRVYGIQILDVADPAHPKHISQVRTSEAQSVFYKDGLLYVGDWAVGRLTIIDAHDLRNPEIISERRLDGFGDGVFVKGNLCFCSTGHDSKSGPKEKRQGKGRGLEVFDVSNPQKPVKLGVFKFPPFLHRDNDYWTVRVCGNTAFCVDSHNGFYIVDVADPAFMKGIANVQLPSSRYDGKFLNDCCASLAVGNGAVYIAGLSTGIYVVKNPDAVTLRPPPALKLNIPPEQTGKTDSRLMRYNPGFQIYRVAVKDDFIYVAASNGGLKMLKIGKDCLKELKSWNLGCVNDVVVNRDRLYIAKNDSELVAYKIKAGGDIFRLGSYKMNSQDGIKIIHIMKDGKYAVISWDTARFLIFDITDPKDMHQVFEGGRDIPGILYTDMFPTKDYEGTFPVNWHSRGIAWYNLNGNKPELISGKNPPKGSQMDGVDYFKDGYFVFPEKSSKIAYLDSTSPGKVMSVAVKSIAKGMPVCGIPSVNDNIVALSSRREGKVVTVDLSTPERPVAVKERCYDLSKGNCGRVVFYKGKMIIPAGHYGLFMEKL